MLKFKKLFSSICIFSIEIESIFLLISSIKTTIHENYGIATVFLLLTVQNWSCRIPSLISRYSARCLLLQAKKNGTLHRLSDPWFMTYWMTT